MMFPNHWAAIDWLMPVSLLAGAAIITLLWNYGFSRLGGATKFGLATLKLLAIALLAICLLEPMNRYERPKTGENIIVVAADNSESLQLKNRGANKSRAEELAARLDPQSPWLQKLESDFDVRKFCFNRQLEPTDFRNYAAIGQGSSIGTSIQMIADRFRDRPLAGIILLSDGNSTDSLDDCDWSRVPPVYPVMVGNRSPVKDVGIRQVTTSQTNFESAPVTIKAEMITFGYSGRSIVAQLLDESGKELQRKEIFEVQDEKPFAIRFQLKPESRGVNVFKVKVFAKHEEADATEELNSEATWHNNEREVLVDKGKGPFRILYVTGRPNWEYKFLRRAMADDHEVELVALVRIARKAPKFTFRSRQGERTNSLYRGFGNQDDQTAEQYDEPVLIRLGTKDKEELRHGFPKDAETMFRYDAIILDDIEANFFSEDQKSILNKFVSERGGGLMMLGGSESFAAGQYDRTSIGKMLPVYLDRIPKVDLDDRYQIGLTRDGWVQPWVRVNSTRESEQKRLSAMPSFQTVNLASSIKPGATVLSTITTSDEATYPALVVQPFGKGRTAAMMIGDLWRWHLETDVRNTDLMKSWRQTLRWLVADVPKRIELDPIGQITEGDQQSKMLKVVVRDELFRPYDNAKVVLKVQSPEGAEFELMGEPSRTKAGEYQARFFARQPGAYRVTAHVSGADDVQIGSRSSGWVADPASQEFQNLMANETLLQQVAERTGGQLIQLDQLKSFVTSLQMEEVPITETRVDPWWHRWPIFGLAITLLIAEWGLRRWSGLP